MDLILAIEPDRRQATQLRSMVRTRLEAELILAESAENALKALGDRVPDLILTSALLSPKDEILLDKRLHALSSAASHVQTLTIPMLGSTKPEKNGGGMLSALGLGRSRAIIPDGCDPAVFADRCAEYLERARAERVRYATASEQSKVHEPPPAKEPQHNGTGQTDSEQPAAIDPAAWAVPADTGRTIHASGLPGVDALDLDRAPGVATAKEPSAVDSATTPTAWQRVSRSPALEASETARVVVDGIGHEPAPRLLDDDEYSETYEIDLGELTREEMPGASPDVTHDRIWHVSTSAMNEGIQPYEIDLNELLVDGDSGMPKAGAARQALPTPEEERAEMHPATYLEVGPTPLQDATKPETVAPVEAPSGSPESRQPEWLDMVASLQHDVQQLQTDWAEPASLTPPLAASPIADDGGAVPESADAPPPVVRKAASAKSRAKGTKREPKKKRPRKDDWGFFDPEECGFTALLTKLEEVTDDDELAEFRS
jgi:hypothetical protein